MSVEIQWETLTGGPEGEKLAESIRQFIHDRFQTIPLPRFIHSVKVLAFNFGDQPPQIEVKDVCDPLPDFYEEDDDDARSAHSNASQTTDERIREKGTAPASGVPGSSANSQQRNSNFEDNLNAAGNLHHRGEVRHGHSLSAHIPAAQPSQRPISLTHPLDITLPSPRFSSGIPGGTTNLSYFHHHPYGSAGPTTPLAAMAGGHFTMPDRPTHQHSTSISSSTPPSSADPPSRPPSQHQSPASNRSSAAPTVDLSHLASERATSPAPPERNPDDLQVVAHVRYHGPMSLVVTAEILLDYPMPSFVGIPLTLHITGFSFDGVAIVAYINRKVSCCFLSPEDAVTVIGAGGTTSEDGGEQEEQRGPLGGLLEEVRVESEIGLKDGGKQVLKNVGKVEKFVLDQVRRIFEDEFVFPSFWTFLV
ncbi:hypothetical protein BT63DRAFT_429620 [Microthyrium microscopicum]|uniref:Mitochondrial distribution and morphology protein 12 n=1 Tax=Microthyrium microscopicum TaxID=703497 RepID=A0A6A6TW91_9PEZI|nr:hypothetical protein BT63DRAFT_429620 [Microthyrium microscopicum]